MRMALSLPSDGKPLKGVGEVPSWLTDDNAKVLKNAPCMQKMELDLACRHCKPTPRPSKEKNEALKEEFEALQKQNGEDQGSTEAQGDVNA